MTEKLVTDVALRGGAGDLMRVLRLLRSAGKSLYGDSHALRGVIRLAGKRENADVLRWLRDSNGVSLEDLMPAMTWAVEDDNLGALEWFRAQGLRAEAFDDLMLDAATHGRPKIAAWLLALGADDFSCMRGFLLAVDFGHLSVMEVLCKTVDDNVLGEAMIVAIARGHLNCLEFLRSVGADLLGPVCAEMLREVRVRRTRPRYLELSEEEKRALAEAELVRGALESKHEGVMEWVFATYPSLLPRALADPILCLASGRPEKIEWLLARGAVLSFSDILSHLADNWIPEIFEWVKKSGARKEDCTRNRYLVIRHGRIEMLRWMAKIGVTAEDFKGIRVGSIIVGISHSYEQCYIHWRRMLPILANMGFARAEFDSVGLGKQWDEALKEKHTVAAIMMLASRRWRNRLPAELWNLIVEAWL